MNTENILKLAREVGLGDFGVRGDFIFFQPGTDGLDRFAALVAEMEREACAKLAEQTVCDTHLPTNVKIYGSRAAKAIRARGNK